MADHLEIRQQELARLLLKKTEQDLTLVKNVSNSETVADEIIGFHVQQTIEKAMKAVLTRLGIQYAYTHNLSLLYQQIKEAGIDPPVPVEDVEELTAFAVQFRYILYEDEDFDRKAGKILAKKFVKWANGIVEMPVRL